MECNSLTRAHELRAETTRKSFHSIRSVIYICNVVRANLQGRRKLFLCNRTWPLNRNFQRISQCIVGAHLVQG